MDTSRPIYHLVYVDDYIINIYMIFFLVGVEGINIELFNLLLTKLRLIEVVDSL